MSSLSSASGPPLKRLRESGLSFSGDSYSTLDSAQLKACQENDHALLSHIYSIHAGYASKYNLII